MKAMVQMITLMPVQLLEQVSAEAEESKRPRASVVRSAIQHYLVAKAQAKSAGKVLCWLGHHHDDQEKATVCNAR